MQDEMKRYAISYNFKGPKWAAEIYAHSFEEAKEKVKAMPQATVDGVIHHSIYIPVKEKSWLARLVVSIVKKFT
ncbi:hypothetical protein [Haemophilus haemolyticus]|uniref:hypothetical protein n=1 Tax=Haemophilus haemolyticus TaxID=726 RepID=UPI000E5696FE|nr:hypothetical protein [Haemophilus haemolyticus]